jgi:ABC-type sulfate/molybdate transport systems ATPase subunit/ABC-type sulfate transport system permease component
MNRVSQRLPPMFVLLGGILVVYLLLPLTGILPRLSISSLQGLSQPEVLNAAAISAASATVTSLLLLLFGVPLAYLLARREFPGKTLITLLVQLPLALPPSVAGILLLMIFGPYAPVGKLLSQLGLPPLADNLGAIIAAQTFVASPFLIISARSAFEEVDPALEQVATTFGKSPGEIFRRITLALAWPAILSGITLSWVRALGEFGANAMVAYHPYSLPVLAWVQFSESGLNSTVPLVVLMLAVGTAGVALSCILARGTRNQGTNPRRRSDIRNSLSEGACGVPTGFGSSGVEPIARRAEQAVPIAAEFTHNLGDFSLDVHFRTACRRVALLGPSGAGKSLVLKVLAGLIRPAQGHLTIGARTLLDTRSGIWLRPEERRIGYVPQNFALFPHMTVWQNVVFATEAADEDIRRASDLLSLLGLQRLSQHYPHQLSFGQQQRAALARALVRQPDNLLLDEPFASLDTPFRLQLRRELLRILRRLDVSVVLVTHDPQEAYELVEEVIVIDGGRVLQQGQREAVFGSPSCAMVARLLGFRNTFQGEVVSSSPRKSVIRYQNFAVSAPDGELAPGTMIDFCVDPQAVTVIRAGHKQSLPPGTILDGVIDSVWQQQSRHRLAVIVGNSSNPDYWEVEEAENGEPPEHWTERDAVRLFLPENAIRVMGRERPPRSRLRKDLSAMRVD